MSFKNLESINKRWAPTLKGWGTHESHGENPPLSFLASCLDI